MTPIEIMARQVALLDACNPWGEMSDVDRVWCVAKAKDAITALEANGYAIVPVETNETNARLNEMWRTGKLPPMIAAKD